MAERFHLRFADSLVPTLEICVAEVRAVLEPRLKIEQVLVPIVRLRGYNGAHAMRRGQRWLSRHGDKRTAQWS